MGHLEFLIVLHLINFPSIFFKLGPVMGQTVGSSHVLKYLLSKYDASGLVKLSGWANFEVVSFKKEASFIRVA